MKAPLPIRILSIIEYEPRSYIDVSKKLGRRPATIWKAMNQLTEAKLVTKTGTNFEYTRNWDYMYDHRNTLEINKSMVVLSVIIKFPGKSIKQLYPYLDISKHGVKDQIDLLRHAGIIKYKVKKGHKNKYYYYTTKSFLQNTYTKYFGLKDKQLLT